MNKFLTFLMIFMGTVFSLVALNIVLYAMVPGYHDALSSIVDRDDDIPVASSFSPTIRR